MSDTIQESAREDKLEISALATEITDKLISEIEKQPENHSGHLQLLEDSRHMLIREAARATHYGKWENADEGQEFLWNLAVRLPQFNLDILYRKRPSLIALGAAVILGWFLGGILSAVLNFFSLGGEIFRPMAIFLLIWLEEYISLNPKARKIVLTVLGFGGLARFASMAMGGFFRFTGIGSLRQAIFGVARPNIFKFFWFMAGGLFIIVFFSRKVTGIDIPAFRQSLQTQVEQRLSSAFFILSKLERQDEQIARLRMEIEENDSKNTQGSNTQLARAVASILPALNEDMRQYLRGALKENGFELRGDNGDQFVWNGEQHSPLYTTIGLISDGDHVRILREPYVANGKLIKGHAQKIPL